MRWVRPLSFNFIKIRIKSLESFIDDLFLSITHESALAVREMSTKQYIFLVLHWGCLISKYKKLIDSKTLKVRLK